MTNSQSLIFNSIRRASSAEPHSPLRTNNGSYPCVLQHFTTSPLPRFALHHIMEKFRWVRGTVLGCVGWAGMSTSSSSSDDHEKFRGIWQSLITNSQSLIRRASFAEPPLPSRTNNRCYPCPLHHLARNRTWRNPGARRYGICATVLGGLCRMSLSPLSASSSTDENFRRATLLIPVAASAEPHPLSLIYLPEPIIVPTRACALHHFTS